MNALCSGWLSEEGVPETDFPNFDDEINPWGAMALSWQQAGAARALEAVAQYPEYRAAVVDANAIL